MFIKLFIKCQTYYSRPKVGLLLVLFLIISTKTVIRPLIVMDWTQLDFGTIQIIFLFINVNFYYIDQNKCGMTIECMSFIYLSFWRTVPNNSVWNGIRELIPHLLHVSCFIWSALFTLQIPTNKSDK